MMLRLDNAGALPTCPQPQQQQQHQTARCSQRDIRRTERPRIQLTNRSHWSRAWWSTSVVSSDGTLAQALGFYFWISFSNLSGC
jgi:hypothetical protein